MNNTWKFIGITSCLLLAGCSGYTDTVSSSSLAACTKEGSPFESLSFREGREESAVYPWFEQYHTQVDRVITAHQEAIHMQNMECAAEESQQFFPPTAELEELAASLPPWSTGEALERLSEDDIGSVLLEFLRVLECASLEYSRAIEINTEGDDIGAVALQSLQDIERIRSELPVAREALRTTLLYTETSNRLHALSQEITCLQRASLDIRNAFGLIASAVSCMPRAWDAHGTLRSLKEE